jgi:RNA polymerase sigma-70 factor, ECF subfamily
MEGHVYEDQELVDRAKAGSEEAFTALVGLYQERIWRIVSRILRDEDLALEVTQETFTRALCALPRFDFRAKFSTWLISIARNAAFDIYRSRKSRGPHVSIDDHPDLFTNDSTKDPGVAVADEELAEKVRKAMTRLNPRHRMLLTLREYEDMQYEDIAKVLGVPVGTVESGLHRARKRLREILGEIEL